MPSRDAATLCGGAQRLLQGFRGRTDDALRTRARVAVRRTPGLIDALDLAGARQSCARSRGNSTSVAKSPMIDLVSDESQTWHPGLVARWWSEFSEGRPESAYFRKFVEVGQPALDVACGTG